MPTWLMIVIMIRCEDFFSLVAVTMHGGGGDYSGGDFDFDFDVGGDGDVHHGMWWER